MKTPFLLPLLGGLLLVGCSDSSNHPAPGSTNAPTDGSVLTAPVDYLNTVAKSKHSADKIVDTASLNKAIEMFGVQEGRHPKDLDELVVKKVIPTVPPPPAGMKFEYDAKTGTVKVVKE